MFEQRTLYYLNQMGIIPWIDKKHTKSVLSSSPKAAIMISKSIHMNTQSLLNKIIAYLDFKDDELEVITLEEHALVGSRDRSVLQSPSLLAVLSFGIEPDRIKSTEINCPLYVHLSLEELLANPIKKKTVHQHLDLIKYENQRIYSS